MFDEGEALLYVQVYYVVLKLTIGELSSVVGDYERWDSESF